MKPEVATQRWKSRQEFKLETVKLVIERAVSTVQAARDLDMCSSSSSVSSVENRNPNLRFFWQNVDLEGAALEKFG